MSARRRGGDKDTRVGTDGVVKMRGVRDERGERGRKGGEERRGGGGGGEGRKEGRKSLAKRWEWEMGRDEEKREMREAKKKRLESSTVHPAR